MVITILLHAASSSSLYYWDSEDSKIVENVDFILAADGNSCYISLVHFAGYLNFHAAIYDDSITEAFIWCLVKCVLRVKKTVSIIIALEKRFAI